MDILEHYKKLQENASVVTTSLDNMAKASGTKSQVVEQKRQKTVILHPQVYKNSEDARQADENPDYRILIQALKGMSS